MFRDQSQQAYAQSVGTQSTNYAVIDNRDPTANDIFYPLGKFWINQTGLKIWYLNSQSNITGELQSTWILIGSTANILSLSDTANTVVFPSGNLDSPPDNIQLVGGSGITITANPGSHLLTFVATNAGDVQTLTGDDGIAVNPIAGTIQTLGNVVANSTHAKAVFTTTPGTNIENWDVQVAAAIASTNITKVGLAAFDSSEFSVDANGFVSLTTTPGYISLTPYIVGQTGDVHAGFTGPSGIQDAINQAVIDGVSSTNPVNIYIKPGTYSANLTLADGINLVGFTPCEFGLGNHQTVQITGTISYTPGATGIPVTTISNVGFVTTASYALTINTNNCAISFYNCDIECSDIFFTSDVAFFLAFHNCNCIFGSGGGTNGLFDDTLFDEMDIRFFNSVTAFSSTECDTDNININLFFFGGAGLGSGSITFGGANSGASLRLLDNPFINFNSFSSVGQSIIDAKNSDCNFQFSGPNSTTVLCTFNNCITPNPLSISGVQPYDMTNSINEYNVVTTAISYQVLSQDRTISCTAGGITITLPPFMPVRAITMVVKDLNGNAGSSNITINGNGHNIDGSATYTMNVNFASVMLRWNPTSLTWMVI